MDWKRSLRLSLALFPLVWAGVGGRQNTVSPRAQLYKLFDTLGASAFAKGQFGEFRGIDGNGSDAKVVSRDYGFVQRRENGKFYAIDLNFDPRTYSVTDHWTFIPLDLREWLAKNPEKLVHTNRFSQLEPRIGFGSQISALVAARICEQRHFDDLETVYLGLGEPFKLSTIRWELFNEKFANFKSPWFAYQRTKDVLANLYSSLAKACPDEPESRECAELGQLFRELADEEKHHPSLDNASLAKLPPAQQARELVWALRDEDGYRAPFNTFSGAPDMLATRQDGPAARLIGMGMAAVPALVEALKDRRPTLAADPPSGEGKRRVLRMRDISEQILEKIALKYFVPRNQAIVEDSDAAYEIVTGDIERWWADTESTGRKQLLAQQLTTGNDRFREAANRYASEFPGDAFGFFQEIYPKVSDREREDLFFALRDLKSREIFAFAKEQMAQEKSFRSRFAAIETVGEYDARLAVKAAIKELVRANDRDASTSDARTSVVNLLIRSGRPEGVQAIESQLKFMSAHQRADTIMMLSGFMLFRNAPVTTPEGKSIRRIVEKLLIDELSDREVVAHSSRNVNQYSFEVYRPCDLACFQLAQLLPAKYQFHGMRSDSENDKQMRDDLNTWRHEKGLSPLPAPKRAASLP